MSSKLAWFTRCAARVALCAMVLLATGAAPADSGVPFWRVARVRGDALACLDGRAASELTVMACRAACAPIPWQLDERDAAGELALPDGPEPNPEDPRDVVDGNDELLWMASDAGRRMLPHEAPRDASCRLELVQGADGAGGWVYIFAVPAPAPRSPVRYVTYDPARDVVEAARVAIGFGAPTPRYLSVRQADGQLGPNQLDRLKVRASARFLGIVPLGRDEDDIQWLFDAWHAGPIRVVRRERQWVRLGWSLRTPIFRTESVIYRDYVELPVRLRLNFPPAYFFRRIEVQAALDFRDLGGWTVRTPEGPIGNVGAVAASAAERANRLQADWLALQGPQVTIVLRLQLGDSFASLRREILYREDDEGDDPQGAAGERPAIGFRLTEWGEVDRGHHWFAAIATALPAGYDLDEFARQDATSLPIEVRTFPPPAATPTGGER